MPKTIYQCSIPRQSEAECTWLIYSDGYQRCHGTGKQVELCACRSERPAEEHGLVSMSAKT